MGELLVEEVQAAGEQVAGGVIHAERHETPPSGIPLFSDIKALLTVSDVVVDFTNAAAAAGHIVAVEAAGKPLVIGTSGLSLADEAALERASQRIAIVYASSFAPGVNLVLALAEQMGAVLPSAQYDAEIVEMHHRQKVDAPSGTAIGLGRAVAKGRGVILEDVRESGRDGHPGARKPGAIGFAALRGGQVVGEHTLLFASATEHIALTHRAFDRRVFATGAVQAARWLAGRPPGLYNMRDVLGVR